MAARRGINLVPSLLRAADLSLQRAAFSRSIFPGISNEVSLHGTWLISLDHLVCGFVKCLPCMSSLSHIFSYLPFLICQQGAAYLRPAVPVRTLWNSWKSGFSSSSAAQEGGKEDGKSETPSTDDGSGAATAEAGGEAGASAEQETQQEYTTEELQAALNECVENLEAEKKKVSTKN